MAYEHPSSLLGRLRLGREEFCQRLLTMLILGGPYPRWNTRSTPTPEGRRFLDELHRRSFGDAFVGVAECVFVDEFDLPRRHDAEQGGAPDYATLAPGRLWLVELKTERGSHRHGQIPQYFELARHHHPDRTIDITYLTPPMTVAYDPPGPWGRFSHLTWDAAADAIRDVWGETSDTEQRAVVDRLLETVTDLTTLSGGAWRTSIGRVSSAAPARTADAPRREPETEVVARAMELAGAVTSDGRQRALEHRPVDLEDLQALRLAVRNELARSPVSSPLRHVMPWLWQPTSGGSALTDIGTELGYELRLSRYAKPLY